jgi:hypothetical protein
VGVGGVIRPMCKVWRMGWGTVCHHCATCETVCASWIYGAAQLY